MAPCSLSHGKGKELKRGLGESKDSLKADRRLRTGFLGVFRCPVAWGSDKYERIGRDSPLLQLWPSLMLKASAAREPEELV